MNIGVDIDEVVAEYLDALHIYAEKHHNLKLSKEIYDTYNFSQIWNVSKERFIEIFEAWKQSSEFDAIQVTDGAQEALNALAKQHEITFITSRNDSYAHKTESWLKKHFEFPIHLLHSKNARKIDPAKKQKAELCKEHNIAILIEDQAVFSMECAQVGIKVLLIDKPWNKQVQHQHITRVKNWKEIVSIFQRGIN
jgi:uncharacterized HAD superfamily protein